MQLANAPLSQRGLMAKLLVNMRNVPEDEAEELRALLDNAGLDYYETPAGPWGSSAAALGLRDEARIGEARRLLDEYQRRRGEQVRRERGGVRTVLDEIRERPLRFVLYLAGAAVVLYFSTVPFVDFGQ